MVSINGIEYLTEKEVSKKYGLSVHWLRQHRYQGNSPKYYKLERNIFYIKTDMDNWFQENMRAQ